jgi:hypothetical protein
MNKNIKISEQRTDIGLGPPSNPKANSLQAADMLHKKDSFPPASFPCPPTLETICDISYFTIVAISFGTQHTCSGRCLGNQGRLTSAISGGTGIYWFCIPNCPTIGVPTTRMT